MKKLLQTAVVCLLLTILNHPLSTAFAQGTAFTYQGRLFNGTNAANGLFDLSFRLYTNSSGGTSVAGPVTNAAVGVTNGLFTTMVDFGAMPYNGQALWLRIAVSPAGSNSFTTLSPLQPLTATPYAVQSLSVATVPNTALPGSPTFSGAVAASSFSGNGYNLSNLDASKLTSIGNSPGINNFFVGPAAGNSATIGYDNTAVGVDALEFNTTGVYNAAFGTYALTDNTTGNNNTATGGNALNGNTTGSQNTADGLSALGSNGSGTENTALGAFALGILGAHGAGGSNDIGIGYFAGINYNDNESDNIVIGNQGVQGENNVIRIGTPGLQTNAYIAGVINGDGSGLTNLNAEQLSATRANFKNNNFFAGSTSGNTTTSGIGNTSVGFYALISNTTGNKNAATGYLALSNNATGSYNTADGYKTLSSNSDGWYNTAIGDSALYQATNSGNTAIGANALYFLVGGSENTALGHLAGYNYTNDESYNIDIGNEGVPGDNNIIRIGTPGIQTNAYIAGTTIVINNAGAVASGSSIDPSIFLRLYNGSTNGGLSSPDLAGIAFGQNSTRQAIVGGTYGNDYLDFYTGGALTAPKMRIDYFGNVGIGTTNATNPLQMGSGAYCSPAGQWTSVSDRNVKENFQAIDPQAVLARVATLPITEWNYKVEPATVKHVGPMAQDFHSAFGLGDNEKAIGSVDEGGVALAAIQGLNQKVEAQNGELRAENEALKRENEALAQRLDTLQKLVQTALKKP